MKAPSLSFGGSSQGQEGIGANRHILVGAGGAAGLMLFFFAVLTISESFDYALFQFAGIWYWTILLATGFGIQLGLYSFIKTALREKKTGAAAGVAASGGVSSVAMVACCAHHVTDVLPVLGLSAAAVFLTEYQLPLILLGLVSNIVGVLNMLHIIQKHGLNPETGVSRAIFALDMEAARNKAAALAVLIVALAFLITGIDSAAAAEVAGGEEAVGTLDLPARANKVKGVSIEVEPMDFGFDRPVRFSFSLDTHSGSLGFDLTEVCDLRDDKGNVYNPTGWEGSSPGGHHRSGVLTFPEIDADAKSITLTIRNVRGVPERVFEWALR